MSVEEIGEKYLRFSPGGGLLVTVGIPDVTNKSHFKGASQLSSVIMILLFEVNQRNCLLANVIGGTEMISL